MFEQSLLRYIAAGLGASVWQLSRSMITSYSTARARAQRVVIMRAAKIRRIPSGEPDVSVLAGRGHRLPRGDVTFKSALQLSGSPQCLGTRYG
ncbi:hypothetical protein ACLBOM_19145 [Escherichia coli]